MESKLESVSLLLLLETYTSAAPELLCLTTCSLGQFLRSIVFDFDFGLFDFGFNCVLGRKEGSLC